MHSASQASTGASRHDVSAMDRRKAERTFQQNVMTQVLLLSKPDPKALPDFIEIMVSHVITYRAPDIEEGRAQFLWTKTSSKGSLTHIPKVPLG